MSDPIRWGILGAGNIAKKFAIGLKSVADAELLAVGSRTEVSAHAFTDQFQIPRRYSSYEALAADADVDVVYVATPHVFHKEHTLLCLKAGKAVLCEKPFAINAAEAQEMIACARAEGRFLMEAMWTRFLPVMVRIRELIAQGAIGEPRMLTADFGFRANINPNSRLFDLALGGGALLDVGIYPVSLASMIFGSPSRATGFAQLGSTGVDEQEALILGYEGGQLASLSVAIRTTTPQEATLMGTEGSIRIHSPWWVGNKMTFLPSSKSEQVIEASFEGNGYNYEIAAVMACLRAHQLESPLMPLQESLAIMQTLDAIRAPWGLKYPGEA